MIEFIIKKTWDDGQTTSTQVKLTSNPHELASTLIDAISFIDDDLIISDFILAIIEHGTFNHIPWVKELGQITMNRYIDEDFDNTISEYKLNELLERVTK